MKRMRTVLTMLIALLPATTLAAQLLVLNKSDATLVFVDPESGKVAVTVPTGSGPHEVEVSSDGALAFVSNYGDQAAPGSSLSVIDIGARKELQRVDLGELTRPHGLSFSDGHLYFTSEQSKKIGRFDPATKRVDWTFSTDQDGTHMVLASRDAKKLFTTNIGSNTVGIIERGTGNDARQTLVAVGAGPEGLDESPDGRELWVGHSRDGGISIIDIATGKVTHSFDARTRRSNRVKFTPNGQLVLISDLGSGELIVIDAKKRTERARVQLGKSPTGILVSLDGQYAYVAVSGENQVAVLDLKSLKVTKTIRTGNSPDGMAWVR